MSRSLIAMFALFAGCDSSAAAPPASKPHLTESVPAPKPEHLSSCKRTDTPPEPPPEPKIAPPLPEELVQWWRDAKTDDQRGMLAADTLSVVGCTERHYGLDSKPDPQDWLTHALLVVPQACSCSGYTCTFQPSDDERQQAGDAGSLVTSLTSGRTGIGELHVECWGK